MPRKLPLYVEVVHSKGRAYLYFRKGRGKRARLPDNPQTDEFKRVYADCLSGAVQPRQRFQGAKPGTMAALVASYKASPAYRGLRDTTKSSYSTPLEMLRTEHGGRTVSEMTKQRIENKILAPYAERPGQRLAVLKILRVLIRHAISLTPQWLKSDPSIGIKRPKGGEIRALTDKEMAAYERKWPLGTKQRTAYELTLNMGAARADVHAITWPQFDDDRAIYARSKTGVGVNMGQTERLRRALAAAPREHITIINTEHGRPFSAKGFGNFMRAAMDAAGLPPDCKLHGLRKTLGRRLADAGASAHDIMAALGHKTLEEAERYTREADKRRGGMRATAALDKLDAAQKLNGDTQTPGASLGKTRKAKGF